MFHTIKVQSNTHEELIDITTQIKKYITKDNIEEGFVIVYVPHTTAAVTINEGADPDVKKDIINTLASLIPHNQSYLHREGNSDAHIKTSLIGPSVQIIVHEGSLVLGTWQSVFFFEGDGPRNRTIYIKTYKEK